MDYSVSKWEPTASFCEDGNGLSGLVKHESILGLDEQTLAPDERHRLVNVTWAC
jgi:hypothetical protein